MSTFAKNTSIADFGGGGSIKTGSFTSGLNGELFSKSSKEVYFENGDIENVNFDDDGSDFAPEEVNSSSGGTIAANSNASFGIDVNHEAISIAPGERASEGNILLDNVGYALNGIGLAEVYYGTALMSANPWAGLILTGTGLVGAFASDEYQMNANTWYALASTTGLESEISQYLTSKLPGGLKIIEETAGSAIGGAIGGSAALTAMNMTVQAINGDSFEEIMDKAPQTILESTVWVVTDTCVTPIVSAALGPQVGKAVGSMAASIASNNCTEPFKDEQGNVQQDWCVAAEVGVLGGVVTGGCIAAAAGIAAACPVAAIVLGCAIVGYCLVWGIKEVVDFANESSGRNAGGTTVSETGHSHSSGKF